MHQPGGAGISRASEVRARGVRPQVVSPPQVGKQD